MKICFDGQIKESTEPTLLVSNPGFRYGESLFETMRMEGGRIKLKDHHFDRLFSGCKVLNLNSPGLTIDNLGNQIQNLVRINHCENMARIRLTVFAVSSEKNLLNQAGYIIEAMPIDNLPGQLNEEGLVLGLYEDAQKSMDFLSNLKSGNRMLYTMAEAKAAKSNWDDAIILNTHGRPVETTIANIFIIRGEKIFTAPLSEGCVDGVYRRYLMEKLGSLGNEVYEKPIFEEDIRQADEIFITNALRGIRWVKQYGISRFGKKVTNGIYESLQNN